MLNAATHCRRGCRVRRDRDAHRKGLFCRELVNLRLAQTRGIDNLVQPKRAHGAIAGRSRIVGRPSALWKVWPEGIAGGVIHCRELRPKACGFRDSKQGPRLLRSL